MIKNTSGLAVQPCRLHERFYYHARLLYYILRQKARGFFARGLHPRGDLCKDGSPCTHLLGAPPQTPGDFRFTTKVTKGVSGGAPLNPRGGHYHPPSGVAAPPRRTLPLGVVGGVGLCFPPRRIGAQAADTLSFIQEKNCCEPGGEHRPYIADRGRLGYGNKKWEQGNKHLFLLYIHLYIYLL